MIICPNHKHCISVRHCIFKYPVQGKCIINFYAENSNVGIGCRIDGSSKILIKYRGIKNVNPKR